MSPLQVAISTLVKVAMVVTLGGVLVRRRYRLCFAFPVYLVLVLGCDTVVSLWPKRFYVEWFWILQHTLWDVAKLGVALELGLRAFRALPGARPVALVALCALLLLTTLVLIANPPRSAYAYTAALQEWHPKVQTGTIWLMAGVTFLVIFYRVPVHDFQMAILAGFVPYLAVFATLLNLVRRHGFSIGSWVNPLDAAAYLAVCVFWAWAAWRKDDFIEVSPHVARRLQLEG